MRMAPSRVRIREPRPAYFSETQKEPDDADETYSPSLAGHKADEGPDCDAREEPCA
jgi:hypothetical protein